jgi:hypothetical protein
MMLDFEFIPNQVGLYGEPDQIRYAFVVKSLRGKGMLWAGGNGVSGDSSGRQCKQLVRILSKNLLKELGSQKIDIAIASGSRTRRHERRSLRQRWASSRMNPEYKGDDGALIDRPVGLFKPVAFTHQRPVPALYLESKAPCSRVPARIGVSGPCRWPTVRVELDVEIGPEKTTSIWAPPVQDGADARRRGPRRCVPTARRLGASGDLADR